MDGMGQSRLMSKRASKAYPIIFLLEQPAMPASLMGVKKRRQPIASNGSTRSSSFKQTTNPMKSSVARASWTKATPAGREKESVNTQSRKKRLSSDF